MAVMYRRNHAIVTYILKKNLFQNFLSMKWFYTVIEKLMNIPVSIMKLKILSAGITYLKSSAIHFNEKPKNQPQWLSEEVLSIFECQGILKMINQSWRSEKHLHFLNPTKDLQFSSRQSSNHFSDLQLWVKGCSFVSPWVRP